MTKKITSPQDLLALRQKAQAAVDLRGAPKDIQIIVHMGTCGIAAGARDILSALADELLKTPAAKVTLRQSGCLGLCDREPMFTLADKDGQEFRYGNLTAEKARQIVHEHVLNGNPVAQYLITT